MLVRRKHVTLARINRADRRDDIYAQAAHKTSLQNQSFIQNRLYIWRKIIPRLLSEAAYKSGRAYGLSRYNINISSRLRRQRQVSKRKEVGASSKSAPFCKYLPLTYFFVYSSFSTSGVLSAGAKMCNVVYRDGITHDLTPVYRERENKLRENCLLSNNLISLLKDFSRIIF